MKSDNFKLNIKIHLVNHPREVLNHIEVLDRVVNKDHIIKDQPLLILLLLANNLIKLTLLHYPCLIKVAYKTEIICFT